jgi:hypothetical protein
MLPWVRVLALSWVCITSKGWNTPLICYEKLLSNQIYMVVVTSILTRLYNLIKLTKFWHHLVAKELKFLVDKE